MAQDFRGKKSIHSTLAATTAVVLAAGFAGPQAPDRARVHSPKQPSGKNRDKVKAARKQRRKQRK